MKNIAQFFVNRPIMAAVLSLLFVITGSIAVFKLPISEYPEVVPPTVVVRAVYPGASAEAFPKNAIPGLAGTGQSGPAAQIHHQGRMRHLNQLRQQIEQSRWRRRTRPIVAAGFASPNITGFCHAVFSFFQQVKS